MDGGTGLVMVSARNTGTSTWQSGNYALRVMPGRLMSTPQTNVSLPTAVAPGAVHSFSFVVTCNGQGLGGFSAQMASFGQQVGANIVCQPIPH